MFHGEDPNRAPVPERPHALDEWRKLRGQENCLRRETVKDGIIYIDHTGEHAYNAGRVHLSVLPSTEQTLRLAQESELKN